MAVNGCITLGAGELSFEVASIRTAPPWKPGVVRRCTGGPGTSDPGLFRCSSATITLLVSRAYNVEFYRIQAAEWMMTDNYDLSARVPSGATKAQMRTMLQNLLAARFHLVVHHHMRNGRTYSLKVVKGGPYLNRVSATLGSPAPALSAMVTNSVEGHWRLVAEKQTMTNLAAYLTSRVWAPVVDDTGLRDLYDFAIDFAPDGMPAETAPDIFEALRIQLGLRLDERTVPTDFLSIDHADKIPTDN